MDCSHCHGTGNLHVVCGACYGDGKASQLNLFPNTQFIVSDCRECDGSGELVRDCDCVYCDGSGKG